MKTDPTTHAGWTVWDCEGGRRIEGVLSVDLDTLEVVYVGNKPVRQGEELKQYIFKAWRIDSIAGRKLFILNARAKQLAAARKDESRGG